MQKIQNKNDKKDNTDLVEIWNRALVEVLPERLFMTPGTRVVRAEVAGEAALFWGKAAARTAELVSSPRVPSLVITPENYGSPANIPGFRGQWMTGEHPLPGEGSFHAGQALLDFFDSLRRRRIRKMKIYLSGGASSSAWVPRGGMKQERLLPLLSGLNRQPLSIAELNEQRAQYCALKGGGAARWLHRLAPKTQAEVFLISDVFPFGPEVVGSGPFFDGRIRHHVLADNRLLVQAFASVAASRDIPVLFAASGSWGHWTRWLEHLARLLIHAMQEGQPGLILLGGEPQVGLPMSGPGCGGRGGRMTHLAAAMALQYFSLLKAGRIEILCVSSDGIDGASGAAGSCLTVTSRPRSRAELKKALVRFDSASILEKTGALLPSSYTGTNVQDLIAIRLL
jgi:glycerate-2-kinase